MQLEPESLRESTRSACKHHFARRGGSAVPSATSPACLLPRNPPARGRIVGRLAPTYKAEMKLLVRRGRVDPIVTSQSNAPAQVVQEEITESELNSEVELLNSQDLLRKVVLANGLQTQQGSWRSLFGKPSDDVAIAMAVRQLAGQIKVEPLKKTDMISVSL